MCLDYGPPVALVDGRRITTDLLLPRAGLRPLDGNVTAASSATLITFEGKHTVVPSGGSMMEVSRDCDSWPRSLEVEQQREVLNAPRLVLV